MRKSIFCMMLTAAFCASAGTVDFTYNFDGLQPQAYNNAGKAETIDVAIRLSDPGLVGKRVMSLSVPVMGDAAVLTDFSAFLTSELKTKNAGSTKLNAPDICTVEATVTDGMLTASFPEPYVIPEGGVYVGYSLTVPEVGNVDDIRPVAVVPGSAEGGFCYHSTKGQLKWRDLSAQRGVSSAMTVTLEGDFADNAVSPVLPEKVYAGRGKTTGLTIDIVNQGMQPVTTISYSYEGGVKGEGVYDFPEAVPSRYGITVPAVVTLDPMAQLGDYELKIEVTQVNGVANESTSAEAVSPLEVLLFVPKNRPLVEEYTGLSCGWCPGGYVTLKQMAEKHGHENFVAASFHGPGFESGCMVCMTEWPYSPDGFPASQINRVKNPDVLEIPAVWESMRRSVPEGDMEISLAWADDDKTVLKATSKTRFLHDSDNSPYLVSFMLVADGLSDPTWAQYNAYHFTDEVDVSKLTGPYWDLFVGQDRYVYDLVFDDIVVFYPDQKGIAGSLPEKVEAGGYYENTFSVNTSEVTNVNGERIVKDFGRTRVIGMIIDTRTGAVINSASSGYAEQTGVGSVSDETEVLSTHYHDLSGRRLTSPLESGVTIVTETLADGTTRSRKLLR